MRLCYSLNSNDVELVLNEIFGNDHSKIIELSPNNIFQNMMDHTSVMPKPEIPGIPLILVQQFVVSISDATNLESACRVKQRASHLTYHTIDPMVSVTCDYKTKDSTVLLGHIHVRA